MEEVKETKIPTIKQMKAMAFNLRKKFDCHAQIEVEVDAYDHYPTPKDTRVGYQIYANRRYAGESVHSFDSWKDLMDFYKLMISA